jgi:nitrate/nitrite-specific signal transduction histidine kinase
VGRDDSFGLSIMRERAARLRAGLDISGREPKGTRVAVTVGSVPESRPARPPSDETLLNTT